MKTGEIFLAVCVLAVIVLIIIPLDTVFLDFLLILNLAVSLIILLSTLYMREALEFSIFPSLLLITTIFRLGLNVSSTRLILGNNGDAGHVIETFGSFVVQGNIVVGFVIFLIIIIVQFIVITKGAERVSEVAARFTLDAMPGKQMSIDADLNSGLINETQARQRRQKIQREADFYGAMDGASKFIKGDAIVAIIITVINCVGGIIIGMVSGSMEIEDVLQVYTLATVGDGLVSQLPALMISTAMGIVVTKAASENGLSEELTHQLFSKPIVLIICGVLLISMIIMPGFPKLPLIVLGGLFIFLGMMKREDTSRGGEIDVKEEIEREAAEERRPENVYSLLKIDPIELEFGYGIIPIADTNQGGDLLDRVVMIRRQCALELGLIVPVVRLRDNIQLAPNEYVIKIKGNEVARGEVMPDYLLAMNYEDAKEEIEGIPTKEPAFGMPAKWIPKKMRDRAELLGITVVDTPSVISTHLTEVVKRYGHELLGRQETQAIIENLRETHPSLIDEVVPKLVSVGELQKVLANLLREGIPIRDMVTIVETCGDYAPVTKDTDILTRYVRQNLKRTISRRFFPDGRAAVITLSPELEQIISESVYQTESGSYLSLEPDKIRAIIGNLSEELNRLMMQGIQPAVLTSPTVRDYFRGIIEQTFPDVVVLNYNELDQSLQIQSVGVVGV
ncbi:MAG: flagellar biosynthesis protein FlhA [Clostridiales bacterium]|nr:flagellar biosynthesis protein FlhA [Clostridiales bacterium]